MTESPATGLPDSSVRHAACSLRSPSRISSAAPSRTATRGRSTLNPPRRPSGTSGRTSKDASKDMVSPGSNWRSFTSTSDTGRSSLATMAASHAFLTEASTVSSSIERP